MTLTLDANVWIAAYDPKDRFHVSSIDFFAAITQQLQLLNGPAFVLTEVSVP
jgi:hypothetical protein